jgi:hypothetical protein
MKTILINGIQFIVQSFCKDYCYLVPPLPEKLSSIRINFWAFHENKKSEIFQSNQKTDKNWFDFVTQIDVLNVENQLNSILVTKSISLPNQLSFF